MKAVSALECLVLIACQTRTSHKKFAYAKKSKDKDGYIYVNKNETSIKELEGLIAEFDVSNLSTDEEKLTVDTALACLSARILEKYYSQPFSIRKKGHDLESLYRLILHTRQQLNISHIRNKDVNTEAHARCQFSLEFRKTFKTTPKSLAEKESILVDIISKRIWNSANVQEKQDKDKYNKYKKLMVEFYIGSHMLFEEEDEYLSDDSSPEHNDNFLVEDGSLSDLEDSNEFFFGEGKTSSQPSKVVNKPLINQVNDINPENRVSSHYGKVGSEMHRHIRGNQLPEILFYEGFFATKRNEKNNKSGIVPGKYADKNKKSNEDEKNVRAFWIQTERTPDGPNWLDWLKHRTLDFGQYFFLKNIIKSPRPQIAKYVSSKGRGRPDSNPVIIRFSR